MSLLRINSPKIKIDYSLFNEEPLIKGAMKWNEKKQKWFKYDGRTWRYVCSCGIRPCFNLEGESIGKWCFNCPNKPPEALDVLSKKCECGKAQPSFNLKGETIGKWCFNCPNKPTNAVDVKHDVCECGKARPNFNLEGESIGKWCFNCPNKPPEALDVLSKKCECGKAQPNFNLKGETIGKWCFNCPNKPTNAVDVKHKLCPCGKARPNFNLEGETVGIWCFNCPNKAANAVDVLSKKCKLCPTKISNSLYEGYCARCYRFTFPNRPMSRNYKVKENHVFDAVIKLLKEQYPDLNYDKITRDKTVSGCSKRRPDLMIDLLSHWICAENDEEQHKNYDNLCEKKRINELFEDMAFRPMILIKFNCDKFDNEKSLFKICKQTDIPIIADKKEFNKRIQVFVESIIKHIQNVPEDIFTIEYLFYNTF